LPQVDDHCLQLEHDAEEVLSAPEREEAANELLAEANSEPRDETETRCAKCDTTHAEVPFATLQLACKACGGRTPLAPAPPLIHRPTGGTAQHAQLCFALHGEGKEQSLLGEGGAYQVQWREAAAEVPRADEPWADSRRAVLGGLVESRALAVGSRHQVRVRARLSGCACGVAPERGLSACADKGGCVWTPWSLPSVLTTVVQAG